MPRSASTCPPPSLEARIREGVCGAPDALDERHGFVDGKRLRLVVMWQLGKGDVDELDAPTIDELAVAGDRHENRPAAMVGDADGGRLFPGTDCHGSGALPCHDVPAANKWIGER